MAERSSHQAEFAASLRDHAERLSAAGRGREALELLREAVEIYRRLSAEQPERYLADLAGSLNNLSTVLDTVGSANEALEASEEAVEIYRQLAERQPGRHLPDLAQSLSNLANVYDSLGRAGDALEAIEAAVEIYRQLAERQPGRHLPDRAQSLSNLSIARARLGRAPEALAASEEAVEIYRGLSAEQPERYLADLAGSLNNLSTALAGLGRQEEGWRAAWEAVEHRRKLAAEQPERYLPDLARSLNNLSNYHDILGRPEEALAVIEEAVEIYRRMAADAPERYLPDLARSLSNSADVLDTLERPDEALAAIEEVVSLHRWIVDEQPERYLPKLAESLSGLSERLEARGRLEDARRAIEECLEAYEGVAGGEMLLLVRASWEGRHEGLPTAIATAESALARAEEGDREVARAAAKAFLRQLRMIDERAFDAAWAQAVGHQQPPWLRHPQPEEELVRIVVEWLRTPTWEDSQAFLEGHAAMLMTEKAVAALEYLIDSQLDQPLLTHHLEILEDARNEGIEAPYIRIERDFEADSRRQRLSEWLAAEDREDALGFLLDYSAELLDPDSERELLAAALETPERLDLLTSVGLLELARLDSPRSAYELLDAVVAPEEDAAYLEADGNPRLLALARLYAGLNEHDAKRQFQHALAAIASGEPEEAEQAIERCRLLVPSWERPDLMRRLDELAETDRGALRLLAPLRSRLSAEEADPE